MRKWKEFFCVALLLLAADISDISKSALLVA
jgi:hypothetical protein